MNKRIENYINELQHDIRGFERVEDEWFYEIREQHSQKSYYGLDSVNIDEVTLEDKSIIYLVNQESATELVEKTANEDKIIDTLTNLNHEAGDQNIIAIFDTEKEAYDYIEKEYPKIDLTKEVEELFNN